VNVLEVTYVIPKEELIKEIMGFFKEVSQEEGEYKVKKVPLILLKHPSKRYNEKIEYIEYVAMSLVMKTSQSLIRRPMVYIKLYDSMVTKRYFDVIGTLSSPIISAKLKVKKSYRKEDIEKVANKLYKLVEEKAKILRKALSIANKEINELNEVIKKLGLNGDILDILYIHLNDRDVYCHIRLPINVEDRRKYVSGKEVSIDYSVTVPFITEPEKKIERKGSINIYYTVNNVAGVKLLVRDIFRRYRRNND